MTAHTCPLDGLKVLDFTTIMSGPVATRMLADMGADVIKVESAEGDLVRRQPPLREESSSYFGAMNCGKRSITVDLKHPEGVAVARSLAARVDVIVENFRPGVMARLGLDYSSLVIDHLRLVYCSISGFGQAGTDSKRAAYAQVVHAMSGLDLAQMAYMGLEEPPGTAIFTADVVGGLNAVCAIQAALLERERSGVGQHLDVTLFESMLNLLIYEVQEAQFPQAKRRHVYRPFKALDGFVMIPIVTQAGFEALSREAGHPEWIEDPRFASQSARLENWDALTNLLQDWVGKLSLEECEKRLGRAGVACSRYNSPAEALAYANASGRGSLATVQDEAGEFRVPNVAFRMSRSCVTAGRRVPRQGEHTEEILQELLKADDATLRRLREQGAFGRLASDRN